ncbi:hypothetical protein ACJX0J_032904, partial [Zea mays]
MLFFCDVIVRALNVLNLEEAGAPNSVTITRSSTPLANISMGLGILPVVVLFCLNQPTLVKLDTVAVKKKKNSVSKLTVGNQVLTAHNDIAAAVDQILWLR